MAISQKSKQGRVMVLVYCTSFCTALYKWTKFRRQTDKMCSCW